MIKWCTFGILGGVSITLTLHLGFGMITEDLDVKQIPYSPMPSKNEDIQTEIPINSPTICTQDGVC